VPGNAGADRRARTQGARARSGIPRSGPCDQDRTREIRPGGERLRAAPLLSAAVKSPELGRVRATAVPGSPELVREGEDDPTNSMAGLWPRVRGQRGGMAGKRPRTGRRNSSEGFQPRGEGLRRTKAWDSFSRARANSRTDEGALGRTKSAGHREGAADRHGRHRRSQNLRVTGKLSMGEDVSPRGGALGRWASPPASWFTGEVGVGLRRGQTAWAERERGRGCANVK
jgi:hypothetical protein